MWKPGQLVTIKGKVYRICYAPEDFFVCHRCDIIRNKSSRVCTLSLCDKIEEKYVMFSYFKQVYPKTQRGKVLGVY